MYRWDNAEHTVIRRLSDGALMSAGSVPFAAAADWEKEGNTIAPFEPYPMATDGAKRAAAREKFFDELLAGDKSIDAIRAELKADLARVETADQGGRRGG